MSHQFPCSVGGRLLDAGHLSCCHDADAWDFLRLSLGVAQRVSMRPCVLCGSNQSGLAHVLVSNPAVQQQRAEFLHALDGTSAARLVSAMPGDWSSALLTPHLDLCRLIESVGYCAKIMNALRQVA